MIRNGFACILILCLAVLAKATDQKRGNQTGTKDPLASALAEKAFTAMGGGAALSGYQDSVISGSATIFSNSGLDSYPITFKTKGTQQARVELLMVKGMNVRVVDHGKGAVKNTAGTVRSLSLSNTSVERVNHIPLLSALGEYAQERTQMEYLGSSVVADQKVDIIAATLLAQGGDGADPRMGRTLFYINQATNLVDKIDFSEFAENDPQAADSIEVYLDEYESIAGIAIPHHLVQFINKTRFSDILLTKVTFNVGLTDAEFSLEGANDF